ncbi:unnamed protein product [Victoria cruziana]
MKLSCIPLPLNIPELVGFDPVHSFIENLEVLKRLYDGRARRGFVCVVEIAALMASKSIKPGIPVSLQELDSSSPLFKQGSSLRVTGKLKEYSVESAIAVIVDGGANLKVDTQYLRDINFTVGSIYQFIGELLIKPDDNVLLQARVGRNVDGIDLNLYYQSLELRKQFIATHMTSSAT